MSLRSSAADCFTEGEVKSRMPQRAQILTEEHLCALRLFSQESPMSTAHAMKDEMRHR